MADTQEFADFRFPLSKFEPECLAELLEVAAGTVEVEGDTVLIRHCWTERRMTPLNLYLENANEAQVREALEDYGLAIKQLAAANIFPGVILLKNFGVTLCQRGFYDYDESASYRSQLRQSLTRSRRLMASPRPCYSIDPCLFSPDSRFLFARCRQTAFVVSARRCPTPTTESLQSYSGGEVLICSR